MLNSAFGSLFQVAWVTSDMDRSLAMFKEVYGIPSFFVMEQTFDAVVGGKNGKMQLRIANATLDDVQFELIQPLGGGIDAIYRDALPVDGSYANVFHHVAVKVNGTLDDWDRHLAALHPARPIYYSGNSGPGARFVYTDDRALLGHYVEHLWTGPEVEQFMEASIPRYYTKGRVGAG